MWTSTTARGAHIDGATRAPRGGDRAPRPAARSGACVTTDALAGHRGRDCRCRTVRHAARLVRHANERTRRARRKGGRRHPAVAASPTGASSGPGRVHDRRPAHGAGLGSTIVGVVGVVAMTTTVFDPVARAEDGIAQAIGGVFFNALVAMFGVWARKLGTQRRLRHSLTRDPIHPALRRTSASPAAVPRRGLDASRWSTRGCPILRPGSLAARVAAPAVRVA